MLVTQKKVGRGWVIQPGRFVKSLCPPRLEVTAALNVA